MVISFGSTSDGDWNKQVCKHEVPRSSERTSDDYRNKQVCKQKVHHSSERTSVGYRNKRVCNQELHCSSEMTCDNRTSHEIFQGNNDIPEQHKQVA